MDIMAEILSADTKKLGVGEGNFLNISMATNKFKAKIIYTYAVASYVQENI